MRIDTEHSRLMISSEGERFWLAVTGVMIGALGAGAAIFAAGAAWMRVYLPWAP